MILTGIEWGSVADWVSGVGSVLAIFFVYRQIKQQTDQHNEEKGHDFQIAMGTRSVSKEIFPGGTVITGDTEIFFFGTNSGMMPSSFKYIGICKAKEYEILKKNHQKSAIDHQSYEDPEVSSFDFVYASGGKKNKFERVLPGDVSEEISVSSNSVIKGVQESSEDLYLVYMDVLGVIYGKSFGIK
ncbi:MAG: hypothetical protein ABS893_01700 [Aerococcus urinaeequi]|uniref:hypothetical protein n=1 Tax=Leuconostoc TaxID=1243 RepID=UPI0013647D80|nr:MULTISPECIES: hypothetical protein [Leuconostoc]QHM57545.1 hypothetical protein C7M45_00246 [Leuconostoc mesenteroides]